MEKIATELSKDNNYSVLLSGMSDFLYSILFFKPHIVFFGKVDNAQGDWLRCLSDCTVLSMNTEQGGLTHDSILFKHIEGQRLSGEPDARGPSLELVNHHLIIDEESKVALSPFIDPSLMHVVGYPRLIRGHYSLEPNEVRNKMTIGVVCGNNPTKDYFLETFNLYRKKSFPPWKNIEASHVDLLLEYLWIELLVSRLKTNYRIIVRYRPGDGTYLQDSSDLELDRSDSLEYLLSSIDLLIAGHTTAGVEALLAGVPVIGVSGLIQPSDAYVGATDFPVQRLLWQPTNLAEFDDFVDARAANNLELSPNLPNFEDIARNTYFNNKKTDDSIKSIVEVIKSCRPGIGARLDVDGLAELQPFSVRERILLWIGRSISGRLARRLSLIYMRIRRRVTPDSYLLHHVYLPD